MGLFGRDKNENKAPRETYMEKWAREDREKTEIEKLLKELQKICDYVAGLNGVFGVGISDEFERNRVYKFVIMEDSFYFFPVARKVLDEYDSKEEILEELKFNPVKLERNRYTCELKTSYYPAEHDQKYVGEEYLKVEPVRLCFKEKGGLKEVIFDVFNRTDNLAPMADFFQKQGIKNFYNYIDIPDEVFGIKAIDGNGFLASRKEYSIFRQNGVLTMIRQEDLPQGEEDKAIQLIKVIMIPINEIIYYRVEGSVFYEQKISGGSSGNNYGGAVVGGLLFGTAGAIIGSRPKDEKITSETITHDDRVLTLAIKRNERKYYISFEYSFETVLDWLIPEKQYDYVIQKRRNKYEENPMA